MKLKERRTKIVIDAIREYLLYSEADIGVGVNIGRFSDIKDEFSEEELLYALRYLDRKGYFVKSRGSDYGLTYEGYEEWLFPFGAIDEKRVFISYAIEDKMIAGEIKRILEEIGYHPFLAHEDIKPMALWRDKIISDLQSSGIFLALMTENYLKKAYAQQECGFALAQGKRILSLCIGVSTKDIGFCSDYQCMKFPQVDIEKIGEYLKKQLT